jgi:hypothetical protein
MGIGDLAVLGPHGLDITPFASGDSRLDTTPTARLASLT